jgi:phospholipid-binding lipoprotein MlaA
MSFSFRELRMNTVTVRARLSAALLLAAGGLVTGCATSGNPRDPIEGYNRAMYAFNDGVDKVVLKPVAKGYDAVLPTPVRTGVTNFFGNIADLLIGVNNVLQGKVSQGGGDLGRVVVNSTIGVLGVFDVATRMGMEKHEEDFGQTFGRWGMGSGAYVVLPFLGSRTVRDTGGLVLDLAADPLGYIDPVSTRNSLIALRVVNDRADLLPAEKVLEEAALDKYAYVRDAYLQRRRSLIYDGNPPREAEENGQ